MDKTGEGLREVQASSHVMSESQDKGCSTGNAVTDAVRATDGDRRELHSSIQCCVWGC